MTNENNSVEEPALTDSAEVSDEGNEEELFSWVGRERTWLLSGASWYLYGGLFAIIVLLYALLTQAWTLAILTSLLAGTIYLYSQEKAPPVNITLSTEGLYAGEEFFPYTLIKSTWFSFESSGAYLVIALLNHPRARLSISFSPEDKSLIEVILKEYVVIDDFHQDSFLERIEKLL